MMNYLGQYQPGNSVWHQADPRSKLALFIATVLSLFSLKGIELSIPLIIVVLLYLTARFPLQLGWRALVRFKWLLFITLLANWFGNDWTKGYSGFWSISDIIIKLIGSILVAVWLSYVTKPFAVVDGLAKWLQPLQILRFPVSDVALALGLVTRFIPELWEQAEQVILAQRLRGASTQQIWYKNRYWLKSTLIPVFMATLRKASALAMSMEARGYRAGQNRTAWTKLQFDWKDWLILTFALLYGAGCVYLLISR